MWLRVGVVLTTAAVAGFVGYRVGRSAERPSTEALSRIDTLLNAIESEQVRGLDLLKKYIERLEAGEDSGETEQIHVLSREAFDRADLTERELIAYIGAVEEAPRWRHRERGALNRLTHAHTIQENELQARVNMLLKQQLRDLGEEMRDMNKAVKRLLESVGD